MTLGGYSMLEKSIKKLNKNGVYFEIKLGDKVTAIFRKYGQHKIIGEVIEIAINENTLKGAWLSIKVTGGNINDPHVSWLINNKINVLVPLSDVKGVINE